MKRIIALVSWIALSGVACQKTGCQQQQPMVMASPPALTVVLVIDQLRGDELEKYRALWGGGLLELTSHGRWFTQAYLAHGRSETASGHASLATGVVPRVHGVVNKEFYDQQRGELVTVCDYDDASCGPGALQVPTLGDRLRARYPQAKVVSLAQKARSAVLMGGKAADLVAWLDWKTGKLTGYSPVGGELPNWLPLVFEQVAGKSHMSRQWELPRLPDTFRPTLEQAAWQWDPGIGLAFPHRIPATIPDEELYECWMHTPDADRAFAELALRVVERMELGADDQPDVLWLSLSANDIIGHSYGPDSLERVAGLVELDRVLGDLLAGLRGAAQGDLLLVLTADHGITSMPEVSAAAGADAARVPAKELERIVRAALSAAFGPGEHVAGFEFPFVTLHEDTVPSVDTAIAVVTEALQRHPSVYAVWPTRDLASLPDPAAKLLAQSVYPGRSGHLAVVMKPLHIATGERRRGLGADHGNPWPTDRHIPIVLWGEGVQSGRVDTEVSQLDIAATLAERLAIVPQASTHERDARAWPPGRSLYAPSK